METCLLVGRQPRSVSQTVKSIHKRVATEATEGMRLAPKGETARSHTGLPERRVRAVSCPSQARCGARGEHQSQSLSLGAPGPTWTPQPAGVCPRTEHPGLSKAGSLGGGHSPRLSLTPITL